MGVVQSISNAVKNHNPRNIIKNGNFINPSTAGYGGTPDDWTSSNANPIQGGIPALTKQNLIDLLGVADGDIEGLWNLNGNFNDLSANGYNLTGSGSPTDDNDGLMAQAKKFVSASSQYASTTTNANLQIAGSQTWFAFIKPTALGTKVFMQLSGSVAGVIQLYVQSTGQLKINFGGVGNIDTNVVLQVDKWYFVCVVFTSGVGFTCYVNMVTQALASATSLTALSGTITFYIGSDGTNHFSGLVQNAGVLSVALTSDQVKRLFAATMYKGVKIRRSTSNAILYQDLPMDLVERLRGKKVTFAARISQDTASTTLLQIYDGVTTTGSGLITDTSGFKLVYVTAVIGATATQIRVQLVRNTTDGNSWFKEAQLYEGGFVVDSYNHSQDDMTRFPRLLKMDFPLVISAYQFEEGRFYSFTPSYGSNGSMTYASVSGNTDWSFRGKEVFFPLFITGTTGVSDTNGITVSLPVLSASKDQAFGGMYYDGSAGGSLVGTIASSPDYKTATFYKYNTSNWGLGASRSVRANLNYRID